MELMISPEILMSLLTLTVMEVVDLIGFSRTVLSNIPLVHHRALIAKR